MKYLRRVANKTRWDRERNSKIREDLKIQEAVTEKIERTQLRWYGHVKRMSQDRIVRRSVEAKEWKTRARGRPRTTWLDNIKEYGRRRGKTLPEIDRLTKDRAQWKAFTEATRRQ